MANELSDKRIAFLVANSGVEQVELTSPWQAIEQAGGRPVLKLRLVADAVSFVVTSRKPDDPADFCQAAIAVFAGESAAL